MYYKCIQVPETLRPVGQNPAHSGTKCMSYTAANRTNTDKSLTMTAAPSATPSLTCKTPYTGTGSEIGHAPLHEMRVRHGCNEGHHAKTWVFAHFWFRKPATTSSTIDVAREFFHKHPRSHDGRVLKQRNLGMYDLRRNAVLSATSTQKHLLPT